MDVESWTCQTVGEWLDDNGFSDYKKLLTEDHKIDGSVLTTLSESDLRQPPLQIAILGDIKRLMKAIDKLCKSDHKKHVSNSRLLRNGNSEVVHRTKYLRLESRESESGDGDEALTELITRTGRHKELNHPDAEIWKTILSFLYMCGVLMITAFVMVLVHERVPDVHKYPPLPDLFLDNVPYIPWAFKATELIAVCLGTVWFTLLFFHKHRFVLMRRMFSLTGTLFLLRSVCMLITSLSVPSTHLQCEGRSYGDIWEKLQRTWEIWSGFGMTLQGVRTCGDYMFSGHTVCVTLLNFFITEYTSRKYYYVHTFTWVANLFAIFFILAAHEHYSLDVFVAFYLTSRLFLYYHTLANNRSLMLRDKKRTRIWFPLFSLFESKCEGVVPNEYEWPQERLAECVRKYWIKVQEMSKRKKRIE